MMVHSYVVKIKQWVKILLELSKIRITVMVMLTTGAGYLMARGTVDFQLVFPLVGTFLLACGSSALNHWQDRKLDCLMDRTKNRPLPAKRISPTGVIVISSLWILAGAGLLFGGAGLIPFLLGMIALVWYNGIYTYLKRVSSFAVVPGSIIGALPPMIGWASTGRGLWNGAIFSVAIFLFLWQIPHFWLILLRNYQDYQRGAIPVATTKEKLCQWTFWASLLTILSALLIPLGGGVRSPLSTLVILGASLYLLYSILPLRKGMLSAISPSFFKINFYTLTVIIVVSLDPLI